MAKAWPFKDPAEVLDYGFDWTPRGLADDTIEETTAVVRGESPALVVASHGVAPVAGVPAGRGTVTWLSGGEAGGRYEVDLTITTGMGRTFQESVSIAVKEK